MDRFGCTIDKIALYKELQERRDIMKRNKKLPQEKRQKLPEYKYIKINTNYETFVPIKEVKKVELKIASQFHEDPDREFKLLKEIIDTNISRKANIRRGKGLRVLVEILCVGLLCLSAVFKANALSLLYVACVFYYIFSRSKIMPMFM